MMLRKDFLLVGAARTGVCDNNDIDPESGERISVEYLMAMIWLMWGRCHCASDTHTDTTHDYNDAAAAAAAP